MASMGGSKTDGKRRDIDTKGIQEGEERLRTGSVRGEEGERKGFVVG